jgi:hypothetical protein
MTGPLAVAVQLCRTAVVLTHSQMRALLRGRTAPRPWSLLSSVRLHVHQPRRFLFQESLQGTYMSMRMIPLVVPLLALPYFLVQYVPRSTYNQVRRMRKTFHSTFKGKSRSVLLPRTIEEERIARFLGNQPTGHPLIVIGPEGSGKSVALRSALRARDNVVYIDLSGHSVTSVDEFIYHFFETLGYLMPSIGFLQRWLLRERDETRGSRRLSNTEITKAFLCLRQVVVEEKALGWPKGVPVIAVNGLEKLRSKLGDDKEGKLGDFMNFCLWYYVKLASTSRKNHANITQTLPQGHRRTAGTCGY